MLLPFPTVTARMLPVLLRIDHAVVSFHEYLVTTSILSISLEHPCQSTHSRVWCAQVRRVRDLPALLRILGD